MISDDPVLYWGHHHPARALLGLTQRRGKPFVAEESLQGKIVFITGAAGGFGQAMAHQFLEAGSRLVLADLDAERLRAVTAETLAARNLADRADDILGYLSADLMTTEGCAALYQSSLAVTPDVDILVNNAGIANSGLFPDIPIAKWEALMQIDLLAPMRLTAHFVPAMIARRSGHIVNVASAAGLVGTATLAAYCAAKFGLRGFGEALNEDLKPYNVAVTTVYPFFARTAILNSPHYGAAPRQELPDDIIEDPEKVMAELLQGIRRKQLHVYPGRTAKTIEFLTRVAPWALPGLQGRRMRRNAARPSPGDQGALA
jgi:short-subunit dehydrogenase